MGGLGKLSDECRDHLEQALATDDPREKDFHIRNVMQACCVDEIPQELGDR